MPVVAVVVVAVVVVAVVVVVVVVVVVERFGCKAKKGKCSDYVTILYVKF